VLAKVVDEIDYSDSDLEAMAKAIRRGNKGGMVVKFFRKATNYEPPKERTDNFYEN
jgi:hypothetical protein